SLRRFFGHILQGETAKRIQQIKPGSGKAKVATPGGKVTGTEEVVYALSLLPYHFVDGRDR
ncbi:hypothetical protein FRC09_008336, partial [Ceratobasidium sp. 395]